MKNALMMRMFCDFCSLFFRKQGERMKLTLLNHTLPDTVEVGGRRFCVRTDFRYWVQLEMLLFDEGGSFWEKLPELLKLCYVSLPDSLNMAVEGMVSFYAGPQRGKSGSMRSVARPCYSFWQDEELIYAAFYQQYGIDLSRAELHWWQFKALLLGLSEDTRLFKVIQYRCRDISQMTNNEEKRFYKRMKALYRLCDHRSEEEKDAETAEALAVLF